MEVHMMAADRTVTALLVVAALGAMTVGTSAPPTASARVAGYPIKVYFSRHPVSDDRYGAVFAVRRVAPTLGVATFAIGQLLAGPTPTEARAGYFTELTQSSHGPSSCGPAGFTVTLNRRGPTYEPRTATLQFCRQFQLAGVGAEARIAAEVRATLLQFPSIGRVVILRSDGSCFGDLSGLNRCLRSVL
jgi:hypothetical protein